VPDLSAASIAWVTVPLGLALIFLGVLDVFLTVLHVQVESPISNQLNRAFWRGLLAATRGLPERARGEVLGWGAPLMIGGILVFWSLLYIVGFALLYVPFIHDGAVFLLSDIVPSSPLLDALYFSAVSFLTIGYGDIVPLHPLARTLGVLQGAFGLVTLSLSVTYLLSIYPLISRKIGLAESLNQETAGRSDGIVLARRYVKAGRYEALAQRLSGINDELMAIGHAHGLYPVLYYVRPRDVHQSFVRVLAVLQGLVSTLRYGLDREAHADVAEDPRLLILEEGLLTTLHTLATSSHLAPEGATDEDAALARRDFAEMTDALRRAGLRAASPDDARAVEAHARFRAATDHYIRAYAKNAGYDLDAARAPYSRWERDAALVGRNEVQEGRVELSDAADGAGARPSRSTAPAVLASQPVDGPCDEADCRGEPGGDGADAPRDAPALAPR
jgi:hypothetical protein